MEKARIRTASEQLADTLKEEIRRGTFGELMPGVHHLVRELQVGYDTARAALVQLEKEGVLKSRGNGRRRQIIPPAEGGAARKLRVRILLYEKGDSGDIDNAVLFSQLLESGFQVDYAAKSLKELGMDVGRVAGFVKKFPADAWVVCSASREVIEWFAQQPFAALAMYGRSGQVRIAAAYPVMIPAMLEAVRRLTDLGHTRIVMFTREERRLPQRAHAEQLFLDELEAAGISTSGYNLPDWEESRDGLFRRIDELFRVSPPTAIFFQEPALFLAARIYLADRGISAPRDVSLILLCDDASFPWHKPEVSRVTFDYHALIRRIVRWANNVAKGKEDLRRIGTQGVFIEGGTIGPVQRER